MMRLAQVKPRSADESFVAATLDNASAFPEEDALFTTLSSGGIRYAAGITFYEPFKCIIYVQLLASAAQREL